MTTYGITPEGFKIKRLDVIKSEQEADYKNVFGNDIVLTPQSTQGQEIANWSNNNSLLWEMAGIAYNSCDPKYVVDKAQDRLYLMNGIKRKLATKSSVTLTITGTPGTILPTDSLAAAQNGNIFQINEDVDLIDRTIPASGTIDILFNSLNAGEFSGPAGTINIIETPTSGWLTVTNAVDATIGTNQEISGNFRNRQKISTSNRATNIIDSLKGSLFEIDGVREVKVFDNKTPVTDSRGIPAHRYSPIIDGGDDNSVAQAIFINHTSGNVSFGSVTVQVTNSLQQQVDVQFSRPIDVDIWVIVNIKTNSDFPQDGIDQIKKAIVAFSRGELEADNNCDRLFGIGQDVEYFELLVPINSICGTFVQSLFIGTAPAPAGMANIPIAFNEISRFDESRIEVNIIV